MMKKFKFLLVVLFLTTLGASAQVKIGDNPTQIKANSVLELESPNKALLVTRVANTGKITSPVDGMIVYDISHKCFKGYQDGAWTDCFSLTGSQASASVLAQIGREGDNPNTVPSVITVAQLGQIIPAVTGLNLAKEAAYQAYIDANPDLFSSPATQAEIQAMVTVVNAPSQAVKFVKVVKYNGPSPFDGGIGFYGEAVPASSTIEVLYTSDVVGIPYNFTATDDATGLTYSASGTTLPSGTAVLVPNTPTIEAPGIISMTLVGASNTLALSPRIDIKSLPANQTEVVDVTVTGDWDNDPSTPETSMVWMDRNLGAHRAATAKNDGLAYGNNYQWGRGSDGHEIIVTKGDDPTQRKGLHGTTTTLATSNAPGNDLFVSDSNTSPYNWLATPDANLWQGVDGVNNPCPTGYRVPTKDEYNTMNDALGIPNDATAVDKAFESDLKIIAAGNRNRTSGFCYSATKIGYYWTSTPSSSKSTYNMNYDKNGIVNSGYGRAHGFSVRCVKD